MLGKQLRRGIKQQLQYLRRNLGSVETLLDSLPSRAIPLAYPQLKMGDSTRHCVTGRDVSQQAPAL